MFLEVLFIVILKFWNTVKKLYVGKSGKEKGKTIDALRRNMGPGSGCDRYALGLRLY